MSTRDAENRARSDADYQALRRGIREWLQGVAVEPGAAVLEIGPGPHGSVLRAHLARQAGGQPHEYGYVTAAIGGEHAMVAWDITTPPPFALMERFDVVLASEVLEHVRDPFAAMRHLAQCTRPGGRVLVSVPFSFREHQPTDYWRFTQHGLRHLFAQAGLAEITYRVTQAEWMVDGEALNQFVEGRRVCMTS